MTYKEFKEKFPVGSIFDAAGYFGTILEYSEAPVEYARIETPYADSEWRSFYFLNFKLSAELEFGELKYPGLSAVTSCPRCSSEMAKKQSESYGLIDKCPNCGYC